MGLLCQSALLLIDVRHGRPRFSRLIARFAATLPAHLLSNFCDGVVLAPHMT